MKTKLRRSAAWTLSILIHTALAVFIIRAGLKYAVPEGDVSTSVEIEDAGTDKGDVTKMPEPPAPKSDADTPQDSKQDVAVAPPAPPAPEEKPAPQEPKVSKPKVAKSLPTKSVTTEQQAPAPVAVPEKANEETPEDVAKQDTSADDAQEKSSDDNAAKQTDAQAEPAAPVPAPVAPVAPPAPSEPAAPSTEDEQAKQAQDAPAPTQVPQAPQVPPAVAAGSKSGGIENGAGHSIPAFGTPGTTLNEAQLTEDEGNVKPRYPWSARIRRQEGTAVVRAYVQADGTITQAAIHQSSGYPSLDQECVSAYSHWHYKPGAEGWVLKPFRFSLTK